MTVLECPLCCAENFSDVVSLESHLLDLCDNIICPICELQFKTIRTLAWHLGHGCQSEFNENNQLIDKDESCDIQNIQESSKNYISESGKDEIEELEKSEFNEPSFHNEVVMQNTEDNSQQNEADQKYYDSNRDDSKYSESLYVCSVCNITFSSIEEHLSKFHQNENVLVDNVLESDVLEKDITGENQSSQGETSFQTVDFLPKDSNSDLWNNDEVNSLLFVNWESNGCLEDKPNENNYSQKKLLQPHDSEDARTGQWIPHENFFYFCTNIELSKGETIKKKDLITTENWPPSLEKYPMATFIIVNDETYSDEIDAIVCECKPYVFNGHRVRVLKVKGKDGIPCLEDIPFPEEPPSTIVPVLELSHVQPQDLVGSYSVMWPCHLCGTLTYHWSDLAKHCCSSSTKTFPCTLCKKTFHSRRSLNSHYSVYHKIVRTVPSSLPCPLCPAKVQTASHLEKHLTMHKKNDLIKCHLCESMVQKNIYSDHIKAHGKDGSLSLVCQLCNRPFKGKSELDLHMPQCHLHVNEEDNLKCAVCRMPFSDLSALREHMVSHNIPIKQHLCTFCPKSYYRLIDKVIHERVHTKSKPHSCSECGRCFRLRHSLIAHLRIHTGERPFKCSMCERTFRTKHLQRSHAITHSGLQQFKCKICNKHLKSKDKLEQHEKSHRKPFVCIECKRVFYSLTFAKKHLENHKKNELNFTCNMCPNMFTRAAYLESHLRSHHGLDTLTSISISTQKTYEQMEESVFN